MLGVGYLDLDAIDEFDPLPGGLDLLGRKLGLRGDEGDPAGVNLSGERIGGDLYRGTQLYPAQFLFADIGPQPGMIQISNLNHRNPGRQHLPHFSRLDQDHPFNGRNSHHLLESCVDESHLSLGSLDFGLGCLEGLTVSFDLQSERLGQPQSGFGPSHLGAGALNVLLTRTFNEKGQMLFRLSDRSPSRFKCGFELVML